MTLEQFGILSEIVASIAVIASLIYVARELKQTTNAIHAQSRQSVKEGSMDELFKVMDDPELILLITEKEQLSKTDQSKLNAYFFVSLRSREFAWLQYKNGVIDAAQWETELLVTKLFLDSKKLRIWWNRVGKLGFSKEYVKFIEELIQESPATDEGFTLEFTWFDVEKDKNS